MTIHKADFWDNNYYNHPPLTDDMVSTAETLLKVKLPTILIDLLKIQNGGYTKGFAYPMTVKTTWSESHVPLSELFGIVTDQTIETGQNILDTAYMIEEWGLPDKQVLLNGDGHWWITLDYRQGEIPTVRWIDVECDQDIHIADSFEDFINGLVKEDTFAD
ncbi:SMI1/KNR4 family protein [Flectobacillus roseus]|uniref:SMI1/KNR4 family protein n=1 Tax=Flectobacillus roseus TaxID=502259 RepID=UPI0024B6E8BC|nr:SMI1/KNR4 family protein [Flectobacillus roseus]MDI9868969.1 SMI1/KNR4 family protein [Flectobacillus roseus]